MQVCRSSDPKSSRVNIFTTHIHPSTHTYTRSSFYSLLSELVRRGRTNMAKLNEDDDDDDMIIIIIMIVKNDQYLSRLYNNYLDCVKRVLYK